MWLGDRTMSTGETDVVACTIRITRGTRDRHELVARSRGLPLAAHFADLIERFESEPEPLDTDTREEEARRRAQLEALEERGLLDDAVAELLTPRVLPVQLQRALAVARRGGHGWSNFARVLAYHLPQLTGEPPEQFAASLAKLDQDDALEAITLLLRDRLPAALNAIPARRLDDVLAATIDAILE